MVTATLRMGGATAGSSSNSSVRNNLCDAASSPPAALSTTPSSSPLASVVALLEDDDDNNGTSCASRSHHGDADADEAEEDGGDTVVMNSDDSSASGGSRTDYHPHQERGHGEATTVPDEDVHIVSVRPHDQDARLPAEGNGGPSFQPIVVDRQQDNSRQETFLRIVEQEDVEVSAEVCIEGIEGIEEGGGGDHESAPGAQCDVSTNSRSASVGQEDAIMVFEEHQVEEVAHGDENDECIAAADIEIEEEDLNTIARDMMPPGVARAVPQHPNLRDVDLLEIGGSRLSISALTTTYALDDEDVKLPPFSTPSRPGQHVSNGDETTGGGNHTNADHRQLIVQDDETVSALDVAAYYYAEAEHEEQSPATVAAAATAATSQHLPDFKCQSGEYQRQHRESPVPPAIPTRSPLASVQVSGGTTGSSNNTTRTEDMPTEIPVAPAVLVPDEQLAPEERGGGRGSGGSSPPQSSLTTTAGSGSHSLPPLPPKSERNFWMTVIIIALTLNSMLVGGIVVGGFCAAGKCVATTNNLVAPAPPPIFNANSMVPTPAPSRRMTYATESPAPTPLPFVLLGTMSPGSDPPVVSQGGSHGTTGDFAPVAAPVDGGVTVTGEPGFAGPSMLVPPGGNDDIDGKFSGNETSVTGVGVGNTFVDDTVIDDSDDGTPQEDEASDGVLPVRLLALLAILCEAVIASILFCYYRHWRRRVLASQATTKNTPTISAATGVENETPEAEDDPESSQSLV